MVETTDGFELAERDLEIRGEGELLGARQSGLSDLHFTRLRQDRACSSGRATSRGRSPTRASSRSRSTACSGTPSTSAIPEAGQEGVAAALDAIQFATAIAVASDVMLVDDRRLAAAAAAAGRAVDAPGAAVS